MFNFLGLKTAVDNYIGPDGPFVPLSGGTFTNVFNYTNASNHLSGIISTSSVTMGNVTVVAITTGGQADNDKIPTKGYVDTLFSQYNPNLFVLVAGGTYNNTFNFENVLNRFGGLFTGKIITNDFTLDNKQMLSITTGGSTNNDKLATQGYVDSQISQVGTQVTNNYYNKTYIDTQLGNINVELGNINTTIGGLATTAALTAGLALKADKANTYTKTEIDNMFDGVVPVGDNVGKKYPNSNGGEIFNYYTVNESTTPPQKNIASGDYSHAENYMTTASGNYSHCEGYMSTASGSTTHSEGYMTKAIGIYSHAEGQSSEAQGQASHAEGCNTHALGPYSHAEGHNTYANENSMTAVGKYNLYDNNQPTLNQGKLFVVGNGTADNARSDAFCVRDDGNLQINYTLCGFQDAIFCWSYHNSSNGYTDINKTHRVFFYRDGDMVYISGVIIPPSVSSGQHSDRYVTIRNISIVNELFGAPYLVNNSLPRGFGCLGFYATNGVVYRTGLRGETYGNASYGSFLYYIGSNDGLNGNIDLNNLWTFQFSNVGFYKIPA